MTTKAEALELSIKHWEENAAVQNLSDAKVSSRQCALCEKFLDYACVGCPVYGRTGFTVCSTTPYVEAARFYFNGDGDLENFKIAAQKEVEFLKSLREDVK